MEPKNKVEVKKVLPIFISFLPSFSNSFAAFTDKEYANELNEIKKKKMESDTLKANTHNLQN